MLISFKNYLVHDFKTLFQQNSTVERRESDARIVSIALRIVGIIGFILAASTLLRMGTNEKNPLWKLFEITLTSACSYDLCILGHNISKYINQIFFEQFIPQATVKRMTENTIFLKYLAPLFNS